MLDIIDNKGVSHRQKNDRIFTDPEGGLINPDSITSYMDAFCKRHKLKKITPHGLRHSNVSLLIAAGIPLRTVSARAGHAQLSTTGNIYAHVIRSVDEMAAEAIGIKISPVAESE